MASMTRHTIKLTTGQDRGRLSPCVCNTLRMVSRVVTQLYDDCLRPSGLRVTQFSILAAVARLGEASLKQLEDELAIDQTTLTRSLSSWSATACSSVLRTPTGGSRRCGSQRKEDELWRWRGPSGPRRKAKSCASWAQRRGLTRNGS